MEKIMMGAAGVLLLAVLGLWWALASAQDDVAEQMGLKDAAVQVASQSQQALIEQRANTQALTDRIASLDAALTGMQGDKSANDKKLTAALQQLDTLKKTQGDSDESFSCLDAPVPAALDNWLRDDDSASDPDGHKN